MTKSLTNNIIILGTTLNYNTNKFNIEMLKVDENGNEIFLKKFNDNLGIYFQIEIINTNDNGFAMAGSSVQNNDFGYYILKTDNSGNF